jgi:hypothetical protein
MSITVVDGAHDSSAQNTSRNLIVENVTLARQVSKCRYFRHYKMYQYACMPTFVLNIATLELSNFVQTSPIVPPLQEFMNQEEYDIEQALIQKQKEVGGHKFERTSLAAQTHSIC